MFDLFFFFLPQDYLTVEGPNSGLLANEVWGAIKGLETFSQLVYLTNQGQVSQHIDMYMYMSMLNSVFKPIELLSIISTRTYSV